MTCDTWLEDGLRFECTSCGDCCRNHSKYVYVYLSEADVLTISRHLSLKRDQFLERFCNLEDGAYSLLHGDPDCPFLEKNRCRIYPVRPKQCATWPFWTENLKKETWEGPVADCCPGIGKGALWSAEEIVKIAAERDNWYSQQK